MNFIKYVVCAVLVFSYHVDAAEKSKIECFQNALLYKNEHKLAALLVSCSLHERAACAQKSLEQILHEFLYESKRIEYLPELLGYYYKKNIEIALLFLKHGVSSDTLDKQFCMHIACKMGFIDLARELICTGCVPAQDKQGHLYLEKMFDFFTKKAIFIDAQNGLDVENYLKAALGSRSPMFIDVVLDTCYVADVMACKDTVVAWARLRNLPYIDKIESHCEFWG